MEDINQGPNENEEVLDFGEPFVQEVGVSISYCTHVIPTVCAMVYSTYLPTLGRAQSIRVKENVER